jgi:hypothetical protein
MKNYTKSIVFFLTLSIGACTTNTNTEGLRDSNSIDKEVNLPEDSDSRPVDFNCTRGKAEPIVKKSVFLNSNFELQSDSLAGVETVFFDNNEKLIIKNWGCEYFVLTFRFETFRFQKDTSNLDFWYRRAVTMMSEISGGIEAPIDIEKGLRHLTNYIDTNQYTEPSVLKLGEEIDYGDSEIRAFISVDKIEKLAESLFAIEVSFVVGPL